MSFSDLPVEVQQLVMELAKTVRTGKGIDKQLSLNALCQILAAMNGITE